MKPLSVDTIKAKAFLTVRDVATLLNCSLRTAYRLVEQGQLKGVNLAKRKTLIKRSEIDKFILQTESTTLQQKAIPKPVSNNISDYYSLTEVQKKYGISETALHEITKRNNIFKIKIGRRCFVLKNIIDELFR